MNKRRQTGLIIVYTGNGKGKTTAALGTALRACGYGKKVLMIQFLKGTIQSGELHAAKKLAALLEIIPAGRGYYKIKGDAATEEDHKSAAQNALRLAHKALKSKKYFLVILDEVNVALKLKLIAVQDILNLLDKKPAKLHLILTGRNAHRLIRECADLVTEFRNVKHPFDEGITAQMGIDF